MNLTEEPSTITVTTPKASITGTTIAIILEEHSLGLILGDMTPYATAASQYDNMTLL
ncbi:hypothetical protein ASPFODRAFT_209015 [Aspergillus luchuensis CBS 106.47]|uniref:Uncharacterized protein n=1 Tax=Aspergillus luchuensis (strain CBS 106.47) TaxID=1137211 RepID=A0A1M3TCP8_ASPLC|nr:hypothetical protein ASPFODRAFT_209015 [Aspergillus luchuensis CBS 106.47]